METSISKKDEFGKSKSTILLRYPMPKYSFQGRKLEKTPSEKKEEKSTSKCYPQAKQYELSTAKSKTLPSNTSSSLSLRPLHPTESKTVESPKTKSLDISTTTDNASQSLVLPQANIAGQLQTDHNVVQSYRTLPVTSNSASTTGTNSKPVNVVNPATSSATSSIPFVSCNNLDLPVLLPTQKNVLEQSKDNEARLTSEVESLKSQLEVQLQVNSELKRLLLASMGADLERNVERLARDKAQLSLELGDHVRKMTADYENLDKISIQADMWRSKFLASRVMIDELANGKAFYSLQYQESQDALQKMLNERHEIRTNLLEGYKCLQQVKDAFDPLNTHQSSALPSTNILDLAKRSQQLAEIIRYRLLPASAKVHTMIDIENNWQDRLTPAEILAHEIISKDVSPMDYKYKMPQSLLGSAPHGTNIERYHPHTRYDNLTYNCCAHCKGEISVL